MYISKDLVHTSFLVFFLMICFISLLLKFFLFTFQANMLIFFLIPQLATKTRQNVPAFLNT